MEMDLSVVICVSGAVGEGVRCGGVGRRWLFIGRIHLLHVVSVRV